MENEIQTTIESSKEEEWFLQMIGLDKKKNLEKFQELSKDKDVENGFNKVLDKCSNEVFKDEWEKFNKINISKTLENIIKNDPRLILYINSELKLPFWKSQFSELTTEEKINFSALYEAIYNQHKIQSKDPTVRCSNILQNNQNKIKNKLNLMNISNRWILKNTLTKDFWLTENEAKKLQDYLTIISKHPEFINQNQYIKAGIWKFWRWLIIWLVWWILSTLWVMYVKDLFKPNPETTTNLWNTVIDDPKAILQILTQSLDFTTSGKIEKSLFTVNEDDGFVFRWLKELANFFETKEIEMTMDWTLALRYDMDWAKINIDHYTWETTIYIKHPDFVILNAKPTITWQNWAVIEDIFNEFHNTSIELEEILKQKAIQKAKNDPRYYEEAKQQTEKDVKDLFMSIKPHWINITSVKVVYIDDIPLQIPERN